jgi:hypothetical protein
VLGSGHGGEGYLRAMWTLSTTSWWSLPPLLSASVPRRSDEK